MWTIPFGFAVVPRRVQQIEQILRVHRLAWTRRRVFALLGDELVPPGIAPGLHRDVVARPAQHDRLLHPGRLGQRLVRVSLQRHRRALAPSLILGDQKLAAHVVQPPRKRVRREAAEHDRVRSAQACTGEHRHRDLGDHPHVDPDRRPLGHAELLQGVREPDHVFLQVGVRDRPPLVLGLALPVVGDLVPKAGLHMAIHAVEADVQLPTEVPLRVRRLPLVQLAERLEPAHPLAALRLPELLEAPLVDLRLGVRLGSELLRRRVAPLLEKHRLDRGRPRVWAHGVRS